MRYKFDRAPQYKLRRRIAGAVIGLAFASGVFAAAKDNERTADHDGFMPARVVDVRPGQSAWSISLAALRSLNKPGVKSVDSTKLRDMRDQIVRSEPQHDIGHQMGHLKTTDQIVLPARFSKIGEPAYVAKSLEAKLPIVVATPDSYSKRDEAPAVIKEMGGYPLVYDPKSPPDVKETPR